MKTNDEYVLRAGSTIVPLNEETMGPIKHVGDVLLSVLRGEGTDATVVPGLQAERIYLVAKARIDSADAHILGNHLRRVNGPTTVLWQSCVQDHPLDSIVLVDGLPFMCRTGDLQMHDDQAC